MTFSNNYRSPGLREGLPKTCNKNKKREKKSYLYSSPYLLINNKKTILVSKKEIIEIEKKLINAKFKIETV